MRYAIDGTMKISEIQHYDVVIIGAGLAGLYTALSIDERYSCCILAKETMDISNSWLAQGGIAAAISSDDKPRFHYEDTLIAGAGLCEKEAVQVLVDEGPSDIRKLVSMNVPFDLTEYGDLQITREGGHRKNRIVHAGGDATGRETVKALAYIVSQRSNVTFSGRSFFYDIITEADGTVSGLIARKDDSEFQLLATKNIVIATGGIGQVYKSSTNSEIATGDGIAAAMRAGAKLKNIEFIQFHPTGLWNPEAEARAFLISEAVRGEGGLLKNREGVRFMEGVHELNELAPRDIVARAIVKEMARTGDDHVYVDITAKSEDFLEHRFPTIYHECRSRGINIARDLIPVCPVQHYLTGGIKTDLQAKTNIPGLYACGEAAYTGVHGANRLASNSMLECLVFGRRAAESINETLKNQGQNFTVTLPDVEIRKSKTHAYDKLKSRIQQLMNDYGCVVRNERGLKIAIAEIDEILSQLQQEYDNAREYIETLNIATIAKAISEAALSRGDSVGSHYRED